MSVRSTKSETRVEKMPIFVRSVSKTVQELPFQNARAVAAPESRINMRNHRIKR